MKISVAPGASVPLYATEGAAGADLCAYLPSGPITLKRGERALIPTGITMEVPVGYEAQIRPRSGLALHNGVSILNSPGTIDSDYRGEVKVIVINLGEESYTIEHNERIAQLVVAPVFRTSFEVVDTLSPSKRGEEGFGSTGV